MDSRTAGVIRKMRKALDMIEKDLENRVPEVDDRDEAYYLAGIVCTKAAELEDLVGNTLATDAVLAPADR